MDETVTVLVGIDHESDRPFVDPEAEWYQEGEGPLKVDVPAEMVESLQRAWGAAAAAATAIYEHVGFDTTTGCLPLCDDYDGQPHDWNDHWIWDECWRCGHPWEHHQETP